MSDKNIEEKSRGEGRGAGGQAQGDGGAKYCVCSACGYSEKHDEKGTPCTKVKCPKCGAMMKGSDTKTVQKPYPNYHAARMKAPGLFARIRVMQTTKEGIMLYGGPLKSKPGGAMELQAIRFPKDKFTVSQAKAWLKEHKHGYILFEPASEGKAKRFWPTISGRTGQDNGGAGQEQEG